MLSSEKVANTKQKWIFLSLRNILNSFLPETELHDLNMNRKERKLKGLPGSRFGSMIFLLRMVGIPCKMKEISTVYAIYIKTLIVCVSTTYLGMLGDVYIHRDGLGRSMTTIRVLISFTNVMWIFSICR